METPAVAAPIQHVEVRQAPEGNRIRVLFLQSQSFFGADSMIHTLIMRNLNRDHVAVYTACNRGSNQAPSASLKALEQIEGLHLRPTYFGPTLNGVAKADVARAALTEGPMFTAELFRLARYIKRNKITIIHGTEKPRDAFFRGAVRHAVS